MRNFFTYSAAGVIATLLHYLVFFTTVKFYMAKPWIGTLCGSVSGAMLAYILNYHVTFISKIEHRKALPKFLVIAMLGTIVQTSIVFVSVPRLHFIAAQLIATLFGLFFTFVLNRSWTFA